MSKKMSMQKVLFTMLFFFGAFSGCESKQNGSAFTATGNAPKAVNPADSADAKPAAVVKQDEKAPPPAIPNDSDAALVAAGSQIDAAVVVGGFANQPMEAKTAFNKDAVWVAGMNGASGKTVISRVKLQASENYPLTEWFIGPPNAGSGHRTYLTEVGLIIGQTGGRLYRINDDIPAGSDVPPFYTIPDVGGAPCAGNESRICVASFKINEKPFIGAAYVNSAGVASFLRMPIDKTKPNLIDTSKVEFFRLKSMSGGVPWGYSCFMDQGRNYFWSQWGGQGVIHGINVATGQQLDVTKHAPNALFKSVPTSVMAIRGTESRSYRMSGDADGNLINTDVLISASPTYNGNTYDASTKWTFTTDSTHLIVSDPRCFSSISNCTGRQFTFNLADYGAGGIGPISSLNDNRVAGLTQGANSTIMLISLVDPKDASKGITIKNIKTVRGNAYMYNDFTGNTLYAATNELTFDLTKAKAIQPGKPIKKLLFNWTTASKMTEPWIGLKLEARCYATGAAKPQYQEVTNVPPSNEAKEIQTDSCKSGTMYNNVDIKISGNGSVGGFTKTETVTISGEQ